MQQELTNYQFWQIEYKGNILPDPNLEIEEPGEEEARRFAEWDQLNHELLMHEQEY